jgi:hypothetical protein
MFYWELKVPHLCKRIIRIMRAIFLGMLLPLLSQELWLPQDLSINVFVHLESFVVVAWHQLYGLKELVMLAPVQATHQQVWNMWVKRHFMRVIAFCLLLVTTLQRCRSLIAVYFC